MSSLYERDFTKILTEEEKDAVEAESNWEKDSKGHYGKNISSSPRFIHSNEKVRDFLWHYNSLFPNNHLNPITVKELDHEKEKEEFILQLDNAKNEHDIQIYIKNNKKWFIPATLFKEYHLGSHEAYLFREQKLFDDFQVDYLLLGKNSNGFSMVLVEFETPKTNFILENEYLFMH